MEGRTTLIVAHRLSTISLADRVVLMDAGRVVADGTHLELLETVPLYVEVLAQAEELERLRPTARRNRSHEVSGQVMGGPMAGGAAQRRQPRRRTAVRRGPVGDAGRRRPAAGRRAGPRRPARPLHLPGRRPASFATSPCGACCSGTGSWALLAVLLVCIVSVANQAGPKLVSYAIDDGMIHPDMAVVGCGRISLPGFASGSPPSPSGPW